MTNIIPDPEEDEKLALALAKWKDYEREQRERIERINANVLSRTDYSPLPKSNDLEKEGWHLVGVVDVDAGIVMVGDPCYASVDKDQNPEDRHPIHDWYKFCTLISEGDNPDPTAKSLNHPAGHSGAGVVVSSGEGDGSYPVYVRYHLDHSWGRPIRRISEMRVVFMSEYEDEE